MLQMIHTQERYPTTCNYLLLSSQFIETDTLGHHGIPRSSGVSSCTGLLSSLEHSENVAKEKGKINQRICGVVPANGKLTFFHGQIVNTSYYRMPMQ
mmetsp:Transcript_20123/g.32476  ORF Transcript_20123/g.32476 Transcript_20123/m.32476 type:complete len:97 (-) Transcript_20123:175-465(-)